MKKIIGRCSCKMAQKLYFTRDIKNVFQHSKLDQKYNNCAILPQN